MNLDINLSNKQLIVRKKVVSFIKNYAKFNNTAFEYEHLKAVLYNEKKFINDEENNIVYEYEYDDYGNIITIKTSNNNIYTNKSLSYDSLNRLISYNGDDVIYSSVNPWLIQYINGFNLTFDDNKLTRISKNNMDYSYIYDDKGFRLKKINNNTDEITEYFYEGNNLVLETCNNYKIYYYYDENNDLIGFKYNNQKYYYIRNIFNTIEKVIDSNGNIVISYRYDPYGRVIMTTKANNAPINHFVYKGYYYDDETEFYYLLSRYYYPEICRRISPDLIDYLDHQSIIGLNLYSYCNNDPVNKYDPTGHSAIALLIAFGIGAVLGGIYGGVSAAANGQNVLAGIAIGAVVGGVTGLITEKASVPLMLFLTFAVGASGDIASQIILDEKSFWEVNLISAAWAGVANAGLALVGKGLSIVDKMAGLTTAESIIFGTMTNSPLLGLGMAINMGISKHALVYTVNDLYNDTFGKYKQLTWRGKI